MDFTAKMKPAPIDEARVRALDDGVLGWIERASEYERWRMAHTLGAMTYVPSRALEEIRKHTPRVTNKET